MTARRAARAMGVAGVVATVSALALILPVLPASAEAAPRPSPPPSNCGPYGCPTTSTSQTGIRCRISIHVGRPGVRVVITCTGVTPGTFVRVFFSGRFVTSGTMQPGTGGTAPASVGQPVILNQGVSPGVKAQSSAPISYIPFAVPNFAPGTYSVVIAGNSFSRNVGPFTIPGAHGVSAATGAGAGGAGSSTTSSSLAYTGLQIAMWVLVALAVIAAGYVLIRYGRDRRAQA